LWVEQTNFSEEWNVFVVTKARRATIELGDRILQVFQLPDGEYGLSQTQVGELPGKDENYVRKFLGSKSPEALPYKNFTPVKLPVEGERTRINLIPIDLAIAFWTKEATAGNVEAARLLGACAVESIERRADKAFGIERTEVERNQRLVATFQRLGEYFPSGRDLISLPTATTPWNLDEYHEIAPLLSRDFKYGIPGQTHGDMVRQAILLAARTKNWRLRLEPEFHFLVLRRKNYRYPDLESDIFTVSIDGEEKRLIFLFDCKDPIVEEDDVKECVYDRKYLSLARRKYGVDYAFLILFAPFGASPYAQQYIQESLAPEDSRAIRIITVKQFFQFLNDRVAENMENSTKKASITKEINRFLNYEFPKPPQQLPKNHR